MAATLFKRHFGATPTHVVRAPGACALLGDTADSNQSLVLAVAVNRFVEIASAPRADGRVELAYAGSPKRESFTLGSLQPNPEAPWAEIFKALMEQLRRRGASLRGYNAAIAGELGAGEEMGEPVAMAVAAALTLRALFPFSLTETGLTKPPERNAKGELPPIPQAEMVQFARLCRGAAAKGFHTPCGLVETMASLCGKAWHVLSLDLRFLSVERWPLIGEVIVFCRPDAGGGVGEAERGAGAAEAWVEYVKTCAAAAKKLGALSLRSVELKFLEANKGRLTESERACARHVVAENQRVVFAERALRADDHRQLGELILLSHESWREVSQQRSPGVELLMELARGQPGCLGSRTASGGRGDGTINLVSYHQAEGFMNHMTREYPRRTGSGLRCFVCQIADGAGKKGRFK